MKDPRSFIGDTPRSHTNPTTFSPQHNSSCRHLPADVHTIIYWCRILLPSSSATPALDATDEWRVPVQSTLSSCFIPTSPFQGHVSPPSNRYGRTCNLVFPTRPAICGQIWLGNVVDPEPDYRRTVAMTWADPCTVEVRLASALEYLSVFSSETLLFVVVMGK